MPNDCRPQTTPNIDACKDGEMPTSVALYSADANVQPPHLNFIGSPGTQANPTGAPNQENEPNGVTDIGEVNKIDVDVRIPTAADSEYSCEPQESDLSGDRRNFPKRPRNRRSRPKRRSEKLKTRKSRPKLQLPPVKVEYDENGRRIVTTRRSYKYFKPSSRDFVRENKRGVTNVMPCSRVKKKNATSARGDHSESGRGDVSQSLHNEQFRRKSEMRPQSGRLRRSASQKGLRERVDKRLSDSVFSGTSDRSENEQSSRMGKLRLLKSRSNRGMLPTALFVCSTNIFGFHEHRWVHHPE